MKIRKDVDGLLLFEKNTGLNILNDEIKIELPDLSPRHVSIALLNKCNLNCPYCYIRHDENIIEYNELIKYVHVLDRNGCLSIGLGGGEPTLYSYLDELLSEISDTEMACTMTTNGSESIEKYKKILDKIQLLRFSMDGLKDVYEKNRKQSFEILLQKLIELRAYSNNIGINYLLTDETVEQLDDFRKIVLEIRPKEVLLIPCLDIGNKRIMTLDSEIKLKEWLSNNTDLPIAFSYSSIDLIDSDLMLPVQSFDYAKQKYYFAHISAKKGIMKNVFEKNQIAIIDSLENALSKYRKED
ncbi:MAG: radical SAM protein [Acholeplasmataceae bacterium]|jgi:sulfatase maturation enzyme AslB (radical SAM superfamily)